MILPRVSFMLIHLKKLSYTIASDDLNRFERFSLNAYTLIYLKSA